MKFHEKIKFLRKEKGMSQQELADEIGLNISYISKLENDHSSPTISVLKSLVDLFDISADELLNNDALDNIGEENFKNKPFAEKLRLIEHLDSDEKDAIMKIIDSMLTNHKMKELLNKKQLAS